MVYANPETALVAGNDDRGAFYGLQSLRQLIARDHGKLRIQGAEIRDWPDKPFRGLKLFLPGRANIPFFKRFVREFMALYKYNTLIMQMNASMRLTRHPELNTGWIQFVRDTTYSRRNYPPGIPHEIEQNATHQDLADGDILEKEEVADLARWVRRYHIELIPEIPSFTHSYYLLSAHKDLSEVPGEKWPDTFCPSNPRSYELLFDVFDEYIEVLKPRMIHVGHDELFIPVGLCPRCKDKDIGERYGEDVARTHDYLAGKGIRMAMWGDMLLQGVRGKGLQERKTPEGWVHWVPGGLTREQVQRLIPKDILIFNWFWHGGGPWGDHPEQHEALLEEMGFQQVYGNLTPEIERYPDRRQRATLLGGAPSAWFAVNEAGFGKDLLSDFLGCANILWRGEARDGEALSGIVQSLVPEIRKRFRGEARPSETEPVSLTVSNATAIVGTDGEMKSGLPLEAAPIQIGKDATSLIFLHAAVRSATNKATYRLLWDPEDTADLLGWYEIVYEDGFVITVPIRYGVNIREINWDARQSARDYCYGADAIPQNDHTTFFSFEWKNPRLGKIVREIRLKGTTGFRGASPEFVNTYGPMVSNNAVILKEIRVVPALDHHAGGA